MIIKTEKLHGILKKPLSCPNNGVHLTWERLLQFNKNKKFHMYQEEVTVPIGDWAKTRLKNLSETDKIRDESKVGSGFGKNISN